MNSFSRSALVGMVFRVAVVAAATLIVVTPTQAQNKKNSWEVFLYFGSSFANEIPSAIQQGSVTNYRLEPQLLVADPNDPTG